MAINKLRQLASYSLPVAIFRYSSKTKTFYFDWIKRQAYLSASSKSKSFNIEFQDHHKWSKESKEQIISFLKNKNRFENNSFSFPIKGFINNIGVPDKAIRKLSAKISTDISLIEVTRDRYLADIEINLLQNRIVLSLSCSYGGSIGYSAGDFHDEELIFKAFKDCFILVLSQTDKDIQLFKFINDHNLLDEVIRHKGMLHYLMPKLIASESGNHFTEEIVNHVFSSRDSMTATMIQAIIFLSSNNIVSQNRVESYFNQIIELGLKYENDSSLATSYYNFGGYYRGIHIFDKALHFYNKAFKTDNTYLKRAYFCRELAGILFELEFYKLSAKFYSKAKLLEPNNIFISATLGDAELYSGNYKTALNHFDEFLLKNNNQEYDKYESSLKFTICKALINVLEVESQTRNSKKAYTILKTLTEKDLLDSEKLDEIVHCDALNPIVWGFYATLAVKEKDLTLLFLCSLMQAVLIKFDSKIWAYLAILTTYKGSSSALLNDIVNTAYFYCRESFISELQETLELEKYSDFKSDEFLNHVEKLIKAPKEHPKELRFWDNDEVQIIKF
ncbi:DUF4365 domain-containing protein [Flagellimonas marinaquae]|nr:DUF4365 domain-containing protein [Allomuricauda aquimarina]